MPWFVFFFFVPGTLRQELLPLLLARGRGGSGGRLPPSRSAVKGSTIVLLGASTPKRRSVSVVQHLSKPLFWRFSQSFLSNSPDLSVYRRGRNSLMYLVHSTLTRGDCRCGCKHQPFMSKQAPKSISYYILLTILYTAQ